MIICMIIKLLHLLAEESKNDTNNDEHQCHTHENTNHRRIDVLQVWRLFVLRWKQIRRFIQETTKLGNRKLTLTYPKGIKSQTNIVKQKNDVKLSKKYVKYKSTINLVKIKDTKIFIKTEYICVKNVFILQNYCIKLWMNYVSYSYKLFPVFYIICKRAIFFIFFLFYYFVPTLFKKNVVEECCWHVRNECLLY